jgi:hypothetical protein
MSSFFLIPFGGIYVDNQYYPGVDNPDAVMNDYFAKPPKNLENYGIYSRILSFSEQFKVKLNNYSKVYFPAEDTDIPLVFYLILPKTGNSSLLKREQESIFTPAKLACKSPYLHLKDNSSFF